MKITKDKFVSLSYTLTVDGNVVEKVEASKPLEFVFGSGTLLPQFEANIDGKETGDKFTFSLTPEEAYGNIMEEAVVELPKHLFMIDGKVNEDLLKVGNMLPMMDNDGNRLMGLVKAIHDEVVTMDFNHPMAGKTLNFEGEVVGVRDSRPEDFHQCGCGCGCEGGDCEDGCDSGCGCH